jgi:hypothetical protein
VLPLFPLFEFRFNLYAKEGQLGRMDARRDTAVIPCGPKVEPKNCAVAAEPQCRMSFDEPLWVRCDVPPMCSFVGGRALGGQNLSPPAEGRPWGPGGSLGVDDDEIAAGPRGWFPCFR